MIAVPLAAGGDAAAHLRDRRVQLPVARGLGKAFAAGSLRGLPFERLPGGDPTLPLSVIEGLYAPLLQADAGAAAVRAAPHVIGVAKLDAVDAFVDDDSGIDFAKQMTVPMFVAHIDTLVGMLNNGEWDDQQNTLVVAAGDLVAGEAVAAGVLAGDEVAAMVDAITFASLQPRGRLEGLALVSRLGGNRGDAASRSPGGAVHSVVAMAAFYALGPAPQMPPFMATHLAVAWLIENQVGTWVLRPPGVSSFCSASPGVEFHSTRRC